MGKYKKFLGSFFLIAILIAALAQSSAFADDGYFMINGTKYATEDQVKDVTKPDSKVVTKGCTIEVYGKVKLPLIIREGQHPSYPDFTWVLSQDNVVVEGKTADAAVYCPVDVNSQDLGGMVGLQTTLHVLGNGVTLKNLTILPNYNSYNADNGYANKTVEIWGASFIMDGCTIDVNDIGDGKKTGNGGALFFNGAKDDITVKNSTFFNCFTVFCDTDPTKVIKISGNTFDTPQDDTYFIGNNTWANPANDKMGTVYVENNTFKNLPADYKKIVYHRMEGTFYLSGNKIESSSGSDKVLDRVSFGRLYGSQPSGGKDCASDGKAVIMLNENNKDYKITAKIENDEYVNVVTVVKVYGKVAVTPASLTLKTEESDTVKATSTAEEDTFTWKSSDTAVATVDSAGKVTAVKAGIAVISATGSASKTTASCTVTVEDPAAPDPVPTPAPVTPTVVTKEDNPVTNDKDVPETVKPATPVITQATVENTTALAKSADVKEEFFAATADGNITVDPVIAKNAVKTVISDDATVDPQTIVTLPVITAAVESGKVAALAMKATGAQLGAVENNVVGDITLIKILKDETGAKFDYTAGPALYDDRSFTLKNADGNNLALTDKIDPAATYTLILFVKDNAKFDYDKTEGSVIDPVAIAMNEAATPAPGGSSSSGCNGGFGALALLGLAIIPAIRKRNK